MRKKKVIGISFLMALTLMLTGCSVFPTLAGMESKEAKAYANAVSYTHLTLPTKA